ncbi:MAG TPA: ADP-forming succinate--CoA ligase subunit beta [Candidatus Aminicenantes bacterium]|nr:ADP-forming succinate--CoA ligase subunit beta [Candidatus Aminicenantes bacterium]
MKLHEFQAKEILKKYGIKVPDSLVAHFPEEAWMHSMVIGYPCMLKSQVLTGGRGKAGGIKRCVSSSEVRESAKAMFGHALTTNQTADQRLTVRRLLIEQCVNIAQEFYFSILISNETRSPMILVARQGGMEIEELSAKGPQNILSIPVNPYAELRAFHIREILSCLGISKERHEYYEFFRKLYRIFIDTDCMMLEINPLVIDKTLNLIPVDVKMDIDENALFRQRDIARLRDMSELEPLEAEARLSDLNFIKLNGTVGCMVNGAGLAMATMDFIALAGARPANFLDVGGVATPETIALGMEILLKDRSIQAIFINIFGGIVRCDKVAAGIAAAAERLHPSVPVIIRLSGSNVSQALEILEKSDMDFMTADTVEEASRILKKVLGTATEGGN